MELFSSLKDIKKNIGKYMVLYEQDEKGSARYPEMEELLDSVKDGVKEHVRDVKNAYAIMLPIMDLLREYDVAMRQLKKATNLGEDKSDMVIRLAQAQDIAKRLEKETKKLLGAEHKLVG